MYLSGNRVTDAIIVKYLITHKDRYKRMNSIISAFRSYKGFLEMVYRKYMSLVLMEKFPVLDNLVCYLSSLTNSGNFWTVMLAKFASGVPSILIDGNKKGLTLYKLQRVALVFGYTTQAFGCRVLEVQSSRGKIRYSEDKIDRNAEYTMGELKRKHIDFPNTWKETGNTINGEKLFKWVDDTQGLYKRGYTARRYRNILYTKVADGSKLALELKKVFGN